MLHDARVRIISFTGSTEVGRKLLREAADNVVKPAMDSAATRPSSCSTTPISMPPSTAP